MTKKNQKNIEKSVQRKSDSIYVQQKRYIKKYQELEKEQRFEAIQKIYQAKEKTYWLILFDYRVENIKSLRIKLEELQLEFNPYFTIDSNDIKKIREFVLEKRLNLDSQTFGSMIEILAETALAELNLIQDSISLNKSHAFQE